MKLINKNLELLYITRQSVIDASFVCACDNCGKPIVNIATVKEFNTSEVFNIGLDCKKTLLDKKIIDSFCPDDWDYKYKIKEYKSGLNEITKFLKICAYKDVVINIDNQTTSIYDKLPNKSFEGYFGNNLYFQNTKFLISLGLGEFLQNLSKIKQ